MRTKHNTVVNKQGDKAGFDGGKRRKRVTGIKLNANYVYFALRKGKKNERNTMTDEEGGKEGL